MAFLTIDIHANLITLFSALATFMSLSILLSNVASPFNNSSRLKSYNSLILIMLTISGFFSILIDELLSADALVSIAEKENRSNIQRICDVLFGTVDLIGILLALLPLYSRQMDNSVIAVNLWEFKPANGWICIICWLLIVAFVLLGIAKMVLNHMCIDNGKNAITISSLLISMTAVLYFSMIRETYCVVIVFLQLMIKGGLLFYAIGLDKLPFGYYNMK